MAPAPIVRRPQAVVQRPLAVAAYRQTSGSPLYQPGAPIVPSAAQLGSAYSRGPAPTLGHFVDCYA